MTKGTVVEARPVIDGRRVRWTLEQLEQQTQQKVRIDWLRFTLPLDAIVRCDRELMPSITADVLADERSRNLVRECRGADAELDYTGAMAVAKSGAARVVDMLGVFEVGQVEDKGLDYYAARCSLVLEGKVVGMCLAGGKSAQQAATVHFNLFGEACLQLSPAKFALVREWVASSSGWLTRVDLACDVWTGEDIASLPQRYLEGAFDVRGHRPKDGFAGCWASGHSRTMTFGKRETGKCLRAYEKGDQLFGHEENDPWVRYEVELRNNSRVLDLDLLTRPADFFAGAYDFCAELLERIAVDADPQRIPAGQKLRDVTAEAALLKLGKWTRDVVAPTACWLLMNAGDMLDFIVQTEAHRLPSRLRGFSLSALRQAVEKVAAGFAPPGAPSINGA